MKSKLQNHQKMIVLQPLENIPKSGRKSFGPMSFDKKTGGNKIKNLPIISEANLSLHVSINYESLRRKYPPKIIVL